MSQKLIVADLKADSSRIAAALNICADDARFLAYLNEAEERMAAQGRWWGSVQEIQLCVDSGCVVFPREVATVERIKVDGHPIEIVNSWYNYTRTLVDIPACSGCTGLYPSSQCGCGHIRMKEHGTVATYSTTRGNGKKIRVYLGHLDDVGKTITLQGYDQYGTWVRTTVGGVMIDGEVVTMANQYADSVTLWGPGSPVAVTREATKERAMVYELDPTTGLMRLLAIYQPSETRPMYQVGHIGRPRNCCTDSYTVTALVSLQHIPLVSDNDWLMFTNVAAYKAAMLAVKAYEEGDFAKGDFYFYGTQAQSRNARGVTKVVNRGGAIPLLNAELRKQTGDKVNAFVRMEETDRSVRDMIGFI